LWAEQAVIIFLTLHYHPASQDWMEQTTCFLLAGPNLYLEPSSVWSWGEKTYGDALTNATAAESSMCALPTSSAQMGSDFHSSLWLQPVPTVWSSPCFWLKVFSCHQTMYPGQHSVDQCLIFVVGS
jgi:hypothetical protein